MQIQTLAQASRYLSRFYANTRSPYTLDNMDRLMDFLGNPQEQFKAVHIGGTSGKTSTAYYMAALLAASGAKTGLTVSPHVDSLTERLQIKGQPLSEAVFCEALGEFLSLIEPAGVKPSWFEVMVSFAYWYFAREQVDYAVVEVGLGGLLDGTNVIKRPDKLCLITDIGLDHTDILGTELTDIAAQKIGIVQPHNYVLTQPQTPAVMRVFEKWCRQRQAQVSIVKPEHTKDSSLPVYQIHNWQLAHRAYQYLEKRDGLKALSEAELNRTKTIKLPGRMDIQRHDGKTVVMDGAHNQQKMAAFVASFRRQFPDTKPAVLLALKEGKEYYELVPLLKPFAGRLIITGFETSQDVPLRSMDPAVLAQAFQVAGKATELIADPSEAYQALLISPENVLVVTGSFYLLSQIRNNAAIS